MRPTARTLVCLFVPPMLALLSACGTGAKAADAGGEPGPAAVTRLLVPDGRYAEAFDHARDALRDWNFMLERVDAQAGVIATQQKSTAGLVTPWDQEQSSFGAEVEDTLQRQKRAVRVEFVPAGAETDGADGAGADLRKIGSPIEMRVTVDVYRWQQSGWRLNTQAILYNSYTRDPQADAGGVQGGTSFYGVAVGRDDALASRLAAEVGRRLQGAARR